jgi:uncharacterized protein YndB with AHSA1/START domain
MTTQRSDTADRELFLSRTLDAPVDLVWEAFSKPEHIAEWWGPNGFTNIITEMDFRPGGKWDLVMHGPDGADYPNESVYKEITPLKKIVFEHLSFPHIIFTIGFEARGEQTFLTWHMLFDSAEVLADVATSNKVREGLTQNVEKLAVWLTEHK